MNSYLETSLYNNQIPLYIQTPIQYQTLFHTVIPTPLCYLAVTTM